jgi:hypothetical protein
VRLISRETDHAKRPREIEAPVDVDEEKNKLGLEEFAGCQQLDGADD